MKLKFLLLMFFSSVSLSAYILEMGELYNPQTGATIRLHGDQHESSTSFSDEIIGQKIYSIEQEAEQLKLILKNLSKQSFIMVESDTCKDFTYQNFFANDPLKSFYDCHEYTKRGCLLRALIECSNSFRWYGYSFATIENRGFLYLLSLYFNCLDLPFEKDADTKKNMENYILQQMKKHGIVDINNFSFGIIEESMRMQFNDFFQKISHLKNETWKPYFTKELVIIESESMKLLRKILALLQQNYPSFNVYKDSITNIIHVPLSINLRQRINEIIFQFTFFTAKLLDLNSLYYIDQNTLKKEFDLFVGLAHTFKIASFLQQMGWELVDNESTNRWMKWKSNYFQYYPSTF